MENMQQAELFSGRTDRDLGEVLEFLNEGSRHRVTVKLTQNRVSMISIEGHFPGSTAIRMHRGFLDAPQEVLDAIRLYVRTHRKTAWRTVSDYAHSIAVRQPARTGKTTLPMRGKVFDLRKVLDEVNDEFFNGRAKCQICWGRKSARKRGRRRSLRFGAWIRSTKTIRINPLLDDERVSHEFLRYIVFHEMLHSIVPTDIRGGRRYDHNSQFRTLERAFPGLDKMERLAGKLVGIL